MKNNKILSLYLPGLGFLLVVYFFFIRPQLLSDEMSLHAEVTSIDRQKRTGSHLLTLYEGNEKVFVHYTFFDDVFDVAVGDSLIRESGSGVLYVKPKGDSTVRVANDQDVLISK